MPVQLYSTMCTNRINMVVIKIKLVQNVIRMSERQYVRMQFFSLGSKMKVVQNVIRMSDSQKVKIAGQLKSPLVFLI